MKTLVLGSGGREHALCIALARDPEVEEVHVAPGNPGTRECSTRHAVDPCDGDAVVELARRIGVDLVVVGPEAPLVAGVADAVREAGIACFGPSREAAQLEGSKAFAKDVMATAGVPTARAALCSSPDEVELALTELGCPYVVKDDGLAGGKGVLVTESHSEAMAHASACERVLVEEYLDGPEISLFAVTDGTTVYPLQPAADYKRLGDGGQGPNTGGMGAYTPVPWAPPGLVEDVAETVLQPTVDEMARRGTPFVGLLYAGLAVTADGVRVVEFNARFGDPETQPLLALLDSSLGSLLLAAATGRLHEEPEPTWRSGAAVGVVMAAAGYPGDVRTGDTIGGLYGERSLEQLDGVEVIQAGTTDDDERLVTAGGRVLCVTAVGDSVADARQRAYAGVERLEFDGAQWRSDIGADV